MTFISGVHNRLTCSDILAETSEAEARKDVIRRCIALLEPCTIPHRQVCDLERLLGDNLSPCGLQRPATSPAELEDEAAAVLPILDRQQILSIVPQPHEVDGLADEAGRGECGYKVLAKRLAHEIAFS